MTGVLYRTGWKIILYADSVVRTAKCFSSAWPLEEFGICFEELWEARHHNPQDRMPHYPVSREKLGGGGGGKRATALLSTISPLF